MIAVRLLPAAFVLGAFISSAAAQSPSSEPPQAAPQAAPVQGAALPPAPQPALPASVPVAPPTQLSAPAVAPQPYGPAAGRPPLSVTQAELNDVELRIQELQAQRPSLGGPITLTAVGGGLALASAYIGLWVWIVEEADTDYGCDAYDGYDCDDGANDHRISRGFAVASLAGLGMSIGGIVWLTRTLKARQVYKPEINALKLRRKLLLQSLRYGFDAERGRYGVSMRAAF